MSKLTPRRAAMSNVPS